MRIVASSLVTLAALLATLLAAGACSKQDPPAPTCEQVTDHLLAMAQKMYPSHGDMGGMGNRATEIANCEARNPSATERRCMLAATDTESMARCWRKRVQTQDRERTRPTPTVPPVPAPAPAPATP